MDQYEVKSLMDDLRYDMEREVRDLRNEVDQLKHDMKVRFDSFGEEVAENLSGLRNVIATKEDRHDHHPPHETPSRGPEVPEGS